MATKLKNLLRQWYLKVIAYITIALTVTGMLLYVGNRGDYSFLRNLDGVSYDISNQIYYYFNVFGSDIVTINSVNLEELDINNKKYWNFDETSKKKNQTKNKDTQNQNNSGENTNNNQSNFATEVGQEQAEVTNSETETNDEIETTEPVVNEQRNNTTETQTEHINSTEVDFGESSIEDTTEIESVIEEFDMQDSTVVYLQTKISNTSIAETVKEELRNFYYVWWNEEGRVHLKIKHDLYGNLYYQSTTYDVPYYKEINLSYTNFLKEHSTIEKDVIQGVLQKRLHIYNIAKEHLEQGVEKEGLVFDIVEKDSEELKEKYTVLPVYVRIQNNYVTNSSSSTLVGMSVNEDFEWDYMENKICYIGMEEDYYKEQKAEWERQFSIGKSVVKVGIIGTFIVVICFLYLTVVTGRKPNENSVFLYKIDSIYSELQWIIGFFVGFSAILLVGKVLFRSGKILEIYCYTAIAVIIVMGMVLLEVLLSQIRLLKAKKWLDSFICFRILKKCFKMLKEAWKGSVIAWKRGKLSKRACIFAIALPIICATWIGVPFVIVFLIYMIYKYMGDFISICEGAEQIRDGKLSHQIKIKNKGGELEKLAENINEISQGLENAVSSELRSERLKSELISNVSHDLKTPLTSIVTYVDLLKQEEIDNDVAKDYIEVIDRKAKRLTVLTNDLFEAAKASSGDMPVNIETLDLNALVRQALGEFDEKLENARLNIRLTLPEQPSYVKADGRLSWRVIDNLLNNVVKYAQKGSRVYIEVKDLGNTFGFIIKNISECELNIPSDELIERFKRGDESRNSEGSGLGLNIANSLIDLQKGSFRIAIDGDLFKAEFELPKSEK